LKKVVVGEEDIVRRIREPKWEEITGSYIMGSFIIELFPK
jgi:hypothetical protein